MSVRSYGIAPVVGKEHQSCSAGSDRVELTRAVPVRVGLTRAVPIQAAALTIDTDYSESRHDVVLLTLLAPFSTPHVRAAFDK